MTPTAPQGPHLVSDDFGRAVYVAGVRIIAGPLSDPPFAASARVVEEDTYLVLSAEAQISAPCELSESLIESMDSFNPLAPGTVRLAAGSPPRLLAVVYDIDREPNWKEAWVARAIDAVLELAAHREFEALELPVLGARHGGMRPARFGYMLRRALLRREGSRPARIRIACDARSAAPVLEVLGAAAMNEIRRG